MISRICHGNIMAISLLSVMNGDMMAISCQCLGLSGDVFLLGLYNYIYIFTIMELGEYNEHSKYKKVNSMPHCHPNDPQKCAVFFLSVVVGFP